MRKEIFLLIFFPFFVFAQSQKEIFFVEKSNDLFQREKVLAKLEKVSKNAYFFVENEWWGNLEEVKREKLRQKLEELAFEFDFRIYPQLTKIFGTEWKPGIDNDDKITIFFHRMRPEISGYFKDANEYLKIYYPDSNEREMIYLNSEILEDEIAKEKLAHEFLHLISFNQKNRILNSEEETFLEEMRAEAAPLILGYSKNLEKRLNDFLKNPFDSLTEWEEEKKDYAIASIFSAYLLDYFGPQIFSFSKNSGILAIEENLRKIGQRENFSDVFRNFALALLFGDCQITQKSCFLNQSLKKIKIFPQLNFLPKTSESSLTLFGKVKEFSVYAQKIIGGKGKMNFKFEGEKDVDFNISLVFCKDSKCEIFFPKEKEFVVEDFDKKYDSLTLVLFSKTKGEHSFSLTFAFGEGFEIKTKEKISCSKITKYLKLGMKDSQVKCLQEFLKSQGKDIYPESLVTGYFGNLTEKAVKRFQKKYSKEILEPLGLKEATGFVGKKTLEKINQILAQTKS